MNRRQLIFSTLINQSLTLHFLLHIKCQKHLSINISFSSVILSMYILSLVKKKFFKITNKKTYYPCFVDHIHCPFHQRTIHLPNMSTSLWVKTMIHFYNIKVDMQNNMSYNSRFERLPNFLTHVLYTKMPKKQIHSNSKLFKFILTKTFYTSISA